MIIAANKMDLPRSDENLKRLRKEFPHLTIVPCSAEAEITLRTAAKAGFIDYIPGSNDFTVRRDLNEVQKKALQLVNVVLAVMKNLNWVSSVWGRVSYLWS